VLKRYDLRCGTIYRARAEESALDEKGAASSRCFECGAPACHEHHVVPRIYGGTRTIPLCSLCHGLAHHRDGNMGTPALTRTALAHKRANGEKTGGAAPYGYRLAEDGIHLEPEPSEQEALALILAWRADGLSLRAVAARLNADAVPARGARWHPTTVAVLVKREAK